jgi:hypothetical protein
LIPSSSAFGKASPRIDPLRRPDLKRYTGCYPTNRGVVDSAMSFILDGTTLAKFKSWFDRFDTSFVYRQVIGNGESLLWRALPAAATPSPDAIGPR